MQLPDLPNHSARRQPGWVCTRIRFGFGGRVSANSKDLGCDIDDVRGNRLFCFRTFGLFYVLVAVRS